MDEDAAVDALKRFGLTTYEAKVFVGLQKLGSGTASDVDDVTDVPRSQVYGAADGLEERGLIDVQQGTPTRYRPVDLAEAKAKLFAQVESRGESAFAYLEEVRGQHERRSEQSEAIWTVRGADNVRDRTVSLVDGAEERVLYGTSRLEALDAPVVEALERRAEEAEVVVVSADAAVTDRARELTGVTTITVPGTLSPDISTGRSLLVDDDTILLSVVPSEAMTHLEDETAFWSSGTGFALMLVGIVREWFQTLEATVEE